MDPTPVSHAISSVVVLPSGALVTRRATFEPLAGTTSARCILEGIPATLADGTVRASLEPADGPWRVSEVRVGTVARADDLGGAPDAQTLEGAKRRRLEARRTLTSLRARIAEVRKWLLAPPPAAPELDEGVAPRRFSAKAWGAYLGRCETLLAALREEASETEAHLRTLEEELATLRSLGTPEEASLPPVTKTIEVALHAVGHPSSVPAGISVSSLVAGASWLPRYSLDTSREGTEGTLTFGALVVQATGEAWDQVQLSLAGSSLDRIVQLPDLPARRIGRAQPAPDVSYRAPASTADGYGDLDAWLQGRDTPSGGKSRDLLGACEALLQSLSLDEPAIGAAPQPVPRTRRGPAPPPHVAMAERSMAPEPASAPMPKAERKRSAKKKKAPVFEDTAVDMKRDDFITDDLIMEQGLVPPMEAVAFADEPELERAKGFSRFQSRAAVHSAEELIVAPPSVTWPAPMDLGGYRLLGGVHAAPGERGTLVAGQGGATSSVVDELVQEAEDAVAETMDGVDIPTPDGLLATYATKAAVSIPSDAALHAVDVSSDHVALTTTLRAVPMVEQRAYARLGATNPFAVPLPEGPVRLFVEGAFSLETACESVGKGGTLHIPVGPERRIVVARNVAFSQEEKGLMGGTSKTRHEISVELRSHMPATVEVEVIERLPRVRPHDEDDAEVRLVDPQGRWRRLGDEEADEAEARGLLGAAVTLEPGAVTTLRLVYETTLPSKKELVGGNRRA